MSRKDYRLIAEAIKKAQERFLNNDVNEQTPTVLVDMIIDDLSDALKQDNIHFDRYKFCQASKLRE
jgi:hypothetical protein